MSEQDDQATAGAQPHQAPASISDNQYSVASPDHDDALLEPEDFGCLPWCEIDDACEELVTSSCVRCDSLMCDEHHDRVEDPNGEDFWCTECAADLRFAMSGLRSFLGSLADPPPSTWLPYETEVRRG